MSLRVDMSGDGSGYFAMLNEAKLRTKGFVNEISHEVNSSWSGMGKSMAVGIGAAFTLEGLKSAVGWFVNTGKEIKETAEQVEMSTDAWQKWSAAVEDAGLSTEGFMRVVEALRQKRTDALTDPKARGELTRLGFSDADITGNMDMSTFTKRALANANGGDLQRSYLGEVIGDRGLKYASAAAKVDTEQAAFSPKEVEQAEQLATTFEKLKRIVEKKGLSIAEKWQSGEIGAAIIDFLSGKSGSEAAADSLKARAEWNYKPVVALRNGRPIGPDNDANADKNGGAKATPKPDTDPMDAKLAQQKDEMALHNQERQQRLLDSQRELMTIADRRASIRGEMPGLSKQISDRTRAANGEGFLTEAERNDLSGVTGKAREFMVNQLRQKYQDDTDTLQLRYNKDQGDLREKPLDFSVDSMSKVGLYSASAVAFNPLVNIGVKTNQILTQIAHNTAPIANSRHFNKLTDPHTP